MIVSRSVTSQFLMRLISTSVTNSIHSHLELLPFFPIIFFQLLWKVVLKKCSVLNKNTYECKAVDGI